jgi:hypothetical protein
MIEFGDRRVQELAPASFTLRRVKVARRLKVFPYVPVTA